MECHSYYTKSGYNIQFLSVHVHIYYAIGILL